MLTALIELSTILADLLKMLKALSTILMNYSECGIGVYFIPRGVIDSTASLLASSVIFVSLVFMKNERVKFPFHR